ncbi:MAG TPA: OB-fold domain-containing protein [Micromonosporaceae bacterium]|jgi:hypothetical protein
MSDLDADVPAPPSPAPDLDSQAFWVAAQRRELTLCRCRTCRTWLQPPLERCRLCAGPTGFEAASGGGEIYSYIVVRHPSVPAFVHLIPYVVALVQLDEGVRMPARLVGVDPAVVVIGARVQAGFELLPGAAEPALIFTLA